MSRIFNSSTVAGDPSDRKSFRDTRLLARPISLIILVSTIIKAFVKSSRVVSTSPTSDKEKGRFMSAPDTTSSRVSIGKDDSVGTPHKEEKEAESPAESIVISSSESEKEDREIFEKTVSSLSGFATPLNSRKW